jgi:kynurenine formamidase
VTVARASGAAAALLELLRGSKVYDLEQPRYFGTPTFAAHLPGYVYTLHRRHEPGVGEARTSASGMIVTVDHSGTHIDALCHQAENLRLYGGHEVDASLQTPAGFGELGAETIAPIIARGLLLDAARFAGVDQLEPGHGVGAAELEEAARAHGISVEEGDVVLVRTGNGAVWADADEYARGPGIFPDASEWLAERSPLAVGADNLAWDVIGYEDPALGTLPGHVLLLVRRGIHIIENLALEELARDEHYAFIFVCLPLKLRGATGSPVRPLAIVPYEEP